MKFLRKMTWKTFLFGVYMWSITALLMYFFPGSSSPSTDKWGYIVWFPVMQIMAVIVLNAPRGKNSPPT